MRIILQDWTFWVCAIVCSVWVFKWTAGHTDDIKLQGWLVVGLNCQVWNWRVFFLKFGTTFTLSHIQKKGIKCTKEEEIRGADMYRILEKLLFLLHPSLLEPYFYGPHPRPKLKEIILNLFSGFFFACCKTLIASIFTNRL